MKSHHRIDLKKDLSRTQVLESPQDINAMFEKQGINTESLFDEEVHVKSYMFKSIGRAS